MKTIQEIFYPANKIHRDSKKSIRQKDMMFAIPVDFKTKFNFFLGRIHKLHFFVLNNTFHIITFWV